MESAKVKSSPSPRRFKVALSFPGEYRKFVGRLAAELASKLGRKRILYDRYHRAEFTRLNLDVYLPELYRADAELVVLLLCPEYATKPWCGLECRHIRQLIGTPDEHRIMLLTWGDIGDVQQLGFVKGDGYLDVAEMKPGEVAEIILERIERPSSGASFITPRVPVKCDRACSLPDSKRPRLMTLAAAAQAEGEEQLRLELELGFPVHRMSIGLLDQRAVSIGCASAEVQIAMDATAFDDWHDSLNEKATRTSASSLQWLVQTGQAPSRLLMGNRTLWATFRSQNPVTVKAFGKTDDRRVLDENHRPLGAVASLGLMAKLLYDGASLPAADSFQEVLTLTPP